jgi:hypothetical protein
VRIAGIVVLGFLAIVLYADIQSIHQIFPISQQFIDKSPDEQTRKARISERDRRNGEVRFQKVIVGSLLVIDLIGVLVLAISATRPVENRFRKITSSAS